MTTHNSKTFLKLYFPKTFPLLFYLIIQLTFINSDPGGKKCDRDTPIIIKTENNKCVLEYCSQDKISSGDCSIENEIIKTQWIKNFIYFKSSNPNYHYRYGSIAISSNGDLVIEVSPQEQKGIRKFYGLSKGGHHYFHEINNEENSLDFVTIIVNDKPKNDGETYKEIINEDDIKDSDIGSYDFPKRFYSCIQFLKLSKNSNESEEEKKKEFLISFSSGDYGSSDKKGYIELYDLKSRKSDYKKAVDFTSFEIYSYQFTLLPFVDNSDSENKNYLLYVIDGQQGGTAYHLSTKIFFFNKNSLQEGHIKKELQISDVGERITSSYFIEIENKKILVVFHSIEKLFIATLIKVDIQEGLSELTSFDIGYHWNYSGSGNNIFNKCLHLKDDIGAFIYYKDDNKPRIVITRYYYETSQYKNQTKLNFTVSSSGLQFSYKVNYNDFLALSEKRFFHATVSKNKDIIYIFLFDIFNEYHNAEIRIYEIKLLGLYNLKIYKEITFNLYNNQIVMLASGCEGKDTSCVNDNDNFFSFFTFLNCDNNKISESITITEEIINESKRLKLNDNEIIFNFPDYKKNDIYLENNIFGYEYSEQIKIVSIPEEINLFLIEVKPKEEISKREEINKNDIIKIKGNKILIQSKSLNMTNKELTISFQFVFKQPNYNKFNEYPIKVINYPETISQKNFYNEEEKENLYVARINNFKINLCNTNCEECNSIIKSYEENNCFFNNTEQEEETICNPKCKTCYSFQPDSDTQCLECKEEYQKFYFIKKNKDLNLKQCFSSQEDCPIDYPFINGSNNNHCLEDCSLEQMEKKECYINFSSSSSEEINKIALNNTYTKLIEKIENYNGNENIIISFSDELVFQITNSGNELETIFDGKPHNVSIIDLGECGNKLKNKYNIPKDKDLIIYKLEKTEPETGFKIVQYELYHPVTKEKLNMDVCKDDKVNIYIPTSLDQGIIDLYQDLSNYGYDLLNPNDTFYTDICTPYTSVNGTDVLLSDRKNDFFIENKVYCQENCEYSKYDVATKLSKCECSVIEDNNKIDLDVGSKKFSGKLIVESFVDVLKFSNFMVLKCYKLVFSLKAHKGNIGSYIIIGCFWCFFICSIVFATAGIKKLKNNIQNVILYDFFPKTNLFYKKNSKDIQEFVNNIKNCDKNKNKEQDQKDDDYNNNNNKDNYKDIDKSEKKFNEGKVKIKINNDNSNVNIISLRKAKNKIINNNFPPKKERYNDNFNDNHTIILDIENNKNENNENEDINQNINNNDYYYSQRIKDNNKNINGQNIIINNDIDIYDLTKNLNTSGVSKKKRKKIKIKKNKKDKEKSSNININNNIKINNLSIPNKNLLNSKNNYNLFDSSQILRKSSSRIIINSNSNASSKDKDSLKNTYINNFNNIIIIQSPKEEKEKENILSLKKNLLITNELKIKDIEKDDMNSNENNDKNEKNENCDKNNEKINEKNKNLSTKENEEEEPNYEYSDYELNDLNYEKALKYDKRTFFQYYCCIVKKEHVIIFTFFSWGDYNLFSIKLCILFFSICLDFFFNVLFFNDKSMHTLYMDYGKYNFISQIPKILYSTLVSEAIDVMMKCLSLTQKDIYLIKGIKKQNNKIIYNYKKIIKCMKIKFAFFFIFYFIFMSFFWYFITAFFSVYVNTRTAVLKDSLISILLSLIYPFGLYLVPTIFRIWALRAKNKNLKFVYCLSNIIPLL